MELDTKLLEKAIIFATKKHEGQVRKGDGMPYIIHPIRVMNHLMKMKKSKNITLLCVATLQHDLLEDTDTTLDEIADNFGHIVAGIVGELTSNKEEISKQGKTQYLLNKMLKMSSYALVIKLCDRLDNIQDMDNMSQEFKNKYITETNIILHGLKR